MLKKVQGFTLIELMVVVAIAGIVVAIGIPNFSTTISNSRLTTNINDFVAALNFARSEAVKRNQNVVVGKTGNNWEDGWQVFVDVDNSNAFSPGDEELKIYSMLDNGHTLRGQAPSYVVYNSTGQTQSVQQFIICAKSTPTANSAKLLILNASGRSSIADDPDLDGIPNIPGGANIPSCTP